MTWEQFKRAHASRSDAFVQVPLLIMIGLGINHGKIFLKKQNTKVKNSTGPPWITSLPKSPKKALSLFLFTIHLEQIVYNLRSERPLKWQRKPPNWPSTEFLKEKEEMGDL